MKKKNEDPDERELETLYGFEEYVRQGEPEQEEKVRAWLTAIGLQAVDRLTPSEYLLQTAREHIDGNITFKDVKDRLDTYYKAKPGKPDGDRTEEADKVSARIAEVLSEKTFSFSTAEYIRIHKRLFADLYDHAGMTRDYNITKSEWVLDGKTVHYADSEIIRTELDRYFEQEEESDYAIVSDRQAVESIVKFVSKIWQIHAFGEGNTRTTAVFAIKYLRSLGYIATNDMFANHSWYFRNALVRANYSDHTKNIIATQKYLDLFFGNLLFGEENVLRNRELHIRWGGKKDILADDTLNDTLNDTLKFIISNPRATQKEIAIDIGKSLATVKRATVELQKLGKLERMNGKRDGYWVVK